ncbi:MAG: ABC transporter ATP-binding protein [Thermomicrobiales bacterium]
MTDSTRPNNPDSSEFPIAAEDLRRSFRKRSGWFRSSETVEAVRGISFEVPQGTIFGMLGPNGAGKTTTIKMLSTLLVPTTGTARINGFDIVKEELQVRQHLGVLFGGDRRLSNQLSGWENLRSFGRLYGLTDERLKQRGEMLLERVHLTDRASERVESYSRGMKQRLHIAKTLLHNPTVTILDEPTIGLDPAAAIDVRELIASLVPEHTVLLTTHDMHEADVLCREIAIVDRGLIGVQGTPIALKAGANVDRQVMITLAGELDGQRDTLHQRLQDLPTISNVRQERTGEGSPMLTLRCSETTQALDTALALLREFSAPIREIQVREPSLEDAFMNATGREFDPGGKGLPA